jgi:hypothetical protein
MGMLACRRRVEDDCGVPMQNPVRADRSADHPCKEPSDHANLDPRRHPKHPKIRAPRERAGNRPNRPASRG